MVLSPHVMFRTSMSAPAEQSLVSTISLSTLLFPAHPWSWIDTIGLSGPSSTHARMTRFIWR